MIRNCIQRIKVLLLLGEGDEEEGGEGMAVAMTVILAPSGRRCVSWSPWRKCSIIISRANNSLPYASSVPYVVWCCSGSFCSSVSCTDNFM